VRIVRAGYDAADMPLVPDESQRIQVTLVATKHKHTTHAKPHANGNKSVGDPTEEVVDPFGR
jgi:hypothetical protein